MNFAIVDSAGSVLKALGYILAKTGKYDKQKILATWYEGGRTRQDFCSIFFTVKN
jgi:hypothetical protein